MNRIITGYSKLEMSDLCQPVPNGTFGLVAATFRLRNLLETHISSLGVENRRLPACTYSGRKPAATNAYKIKLLSSGKN